MDRPRDASNPVGLRYLHLKRSFLLSIRPLLTACSREDINKAFPSLTHAEKELVYRDFVEVLYSLHDGINAEFESFCQEVQVGITLDMVEEQLEEQNLDASLTKSAQAEMRDIKRKLSHMKKEELCYLTTQLQKLEDENSVMKAQIASLKEQLPQAADIEKLKSSNLNYEDFQKG